MKNKFERIAIIASEVLAHLAINKQITMADDALNKVLESKKMSMEERALIMSEAIVEIIKKYDNNDARAAHKKIVAILKGA